VEDRLAIWVSGRPGRAIAFAGDFAAALWRGVFRGDPRHPEER
jgi:hypothetical protein